MSFNPKHPCPGLARYSPMVLTRWMETIEGDIIELGRTYRKQTISIRRDLTSSYPTLRFWLAAILQNTCFESEEPFQSTENIGDKQKYSELCPRNLAFFWEIRKASFLLSEWEEQGKWYHSMTQEEAIRIYDLLTFADDKAERLSRAFEKILRTADRSPTSKFNDIIIGSWNGVCHVVKSQNVSIALAIKGMAHVCWPHTYNSPGQRSYFEYSPDDVKE